MLKKVSIIVCTYNAKDDLKECLASLEKQDYDNTEIVVINDASTDGTEEFLLQFQRQSRSKIRTRTNRTNLGVAGARNEGIRHTTGDIIAFTDADCVADPEWISELIAGFQQQEVAGVGGKIVDARIDNIWQRTNKGHDFVAASEGEVPFIKGCNMSFDGDIVRTFQFNSEIKYGYEELLLCDALIDKGYKIYYKPQAVVHHKHRADVASILKQKYLRGKSSIWYLQQRNRFPIYKRHLILMLACCLLPWMFLYPLSLYLTLILFSIFCLSLLREELMFQEKDIKEIILTFPFLLIIEFAHFLGSCAGLVTFRIIRRESQREHPGS